MFRTVHIIPCENPYEKMWDSFLYFESEPTTKQFLFRIYEHTHHKKGMVYAFQNTSKFIYYVKQARQYYIAAVNSDILVRPLLLYYGMVSLLKAYVLTQDPDYPSHSKVLQHGVTSRKIKKSRYSFAEEEVKIQKEGLLPYVHSFLSKETLSDKYLIQDLLSLIPELQLAYQKLYNKSSLINVSLSSDYDFRHQTTVFYLPDRILDAAHLTYTSFIHYINRFNEGSSFVSASSHKAPHGLVCFEWTHPSGNHVAENGNGFENSLFTQDYKGNFYFKINNEKKLHEITNHYIVMYVLGMLCRYETERWGEIIFSFASEDMYIIHEFLTVSCRKFPNLLYDLLLGERHIFQAT
ncbi:YaaC family protein [Aneurinibacillus terranovensis]|uniref:YaaC family protein n=1 Tax=Aneurinibacillus terranovensis TaxID=278991 RepID=UPI00138B06ED|nr:YaaC family protein [Aneurinibacillus terranovensis]